VNLSATPIVGETVWVRLRTLVGHDRLGDEVWSYGDEGHGQNGTWGGLLGMAWGNVLSGEVPVTEPAGMRVENVLVNPSTTTYDRVDDGHPEAIECDLTLHFPRGFDEDLRGARVTVRGTEYEVIGSPQRYTDANLPPGCPWNLTAKVVRFDG
jgi:hypothetical protein